MFLRYLYSIPPPPLRCTLHSSACCASHMVEFKGKFMCVSTSGVASGHACHAEHD